MAVLGKYGADPRMDPETFKRERSGFWTRSYDHYGQVETWTCDKRKLNQKLAEAMLDPDFAREFHAQGPRILDKLFGEGTAEALTYRTKGDQDRVAMRLTDELRMDMDRMGSLHRKQNNMALYSHNTSGFITDTTATTTTACTSTTANLIVTDTRRFEQRERTKQLREKPSFRWKHKSLVRNMPFVGGYANSGGLLETLQRDFDHWAMEQMRAIQ